jgi:hypothetical protein
MIQREPLRYTRRRLEPTFSLPSLKGVKKACEGGTAALVSPTSLRALKDGLTPSWMQEHRIVPKTTNRISSPHVSDFWSSKQRYTAMKKLFPQTCRSRVRKEFRGVEKRERSQVIARKLEGLIPALTTRFKSSDEKVTR